MANFEAFHWNFSSSINLFFLKRRKYKKTFLFSFFGSSKLLGKVFRTMTITKGLWGKTMDQKFEIGTPLLMRNFFCPLFRLLNFLCASFFFYLLGWPPPFTYYYWISKLRTKILHSNLDIANKSVRSFLFTISNNSLYQM